MPIFGHSASSHAVLANPKSISFPRTICAYGSRGGIKTKMVLGTENKQLLWKVDGSVSGDVVLYDNPDQRTNMLGIVRSSWGSSNQVYIPPLGTSNQPIQEEFRTEKSFLSESHTFSVLVGQGHYARPERFEWKSNGALGGALGFKGYKLVRSATGETVADWSADWTGGLRSKVATFHFNGSGASGELGDQWALMAVMTWLKLYQRYIQTATAVFAGSGAGAGVAAATA